MNQRGWVRIYFSFFRRDSRLFCEGPPRMQPNLLPPRPRAVLGPPLPRTNHRSSSLSPHHPQHFLFCAALLLAATAAHRVAADEAGEAGEADSNALTNDKFLRKEKCDLFERCVPTKFDYTNLNENSAALPPPSQWPQCLGPFVLCSVANCTILPKTGGPLGLFPRQAECGCLSPPAVPHSFSSWTPWSTAASRVSMTIFPPGDATSRTSRRTPRSVWSWRCWNP